MTSLTPLRDEFEKAFGIELLEHGARWDGKSIALWAAKWMAERICDGRLPLVEGQRNQIRQMMKELS